MIRRQHTVIIRIDQLMNLVEASANTEQALLVQVLSITITITIMTVISNAPIHTANLL
jgi:hypothetical protein